MTTRSPINRKQITVELVAAGQPRPYADTFYEAYLKYDYQWRDAAGNMQKGSYRPNCTEVRDDVRRFVAGFPSYPQMLDPYVDVFNEVAPGEWHVRVVVPYND